MTIDIRVKYLGLSLRSPLVPSASPLSADIGNIKKFEDVGAGAVVLPSVFEEQIQKEDEELEKHLSAGTESFAEATTFFPTPKEFKLGPDQYLELIRKAKESVRIPVIASLNGSSPGGWTDYAKKIQEAGADALELNIYYIPTDGKLRSSAIESSYIDILTLVRKSVTIPIAVKLSPFFTSMVNMAKRLTKAGADGLVLFNRFYQPDINLETLEVENSVLLSTPQARRVPLRWIAILYGQVKADLAATSGIHSGHDALKMLMAGATITMMCSALLKNGINHIQTVEKEMVEWMEKHEYESVEQLRGCLSQKKCPDPSAFERAQYIRALQGFKI
jgi:dihydroorotate dehydrogenase (fumarate)